MARLLAPEGLLIAALAGAAGCVSPAPPATPWLEGVAFSPMGPANPGAFSATLSGDTRLAGPYTIRVRLAAGGHISPHTHPDARVITVVAGELCYGFGAVFDPGACTLYPEGSVFPVPANTPHFGVGKAGDAIYQESGVGPSAFSLLAPEPR